MCVYELRFECNLNYGQFVLGSVCYFSWLLLPVSVALSRWPALQTGPGWLVTWIQRPGRHRFPVYVWYPARILWY